MIKIKVEQDGKFISYVKVTGHAGFDKRGKDIVCAAVSTLVITSCNVALRLGPSSITVDQRDGLIEIRTRKHDDIINEVLLNMVDMLKELSLEYKNNIKII